MFYGSAPLTMDILLIIPPKKRLANAGCRGPVAACVIGSAAVSVPVANGGRNGVARAGDLLQFPLPDRPPAAVPTAAVYNASAARRHRKSAFPRRIGSQHGNVCARRPTLRLPRFRRGRGNLSPPVFAFPQLERSPYESTPSGIRQLEKTGGSVSGKPEHLPVWLLGGGIRNHLAHHHHHLVRHMDDAFHLKRHASANPGFAVWRRTGRPLQPQNADYALRRVYRHGDAWARHRVSVGFLAALGCCW